MGTKGWDFHYFVWTFFFSLLEVAEKYSRIFVEVYFKNLDIYSGVHSGRDNYTSASRTYEVATMK